MKTPSKFNSLDFLERVFPWIFGATLVLMFFWFSLIGYVIFSGDGIESLTRRVWCGNQTDCSLPSIKVDVDNR